MPLYQYIAKDRNAKPIKQVKEASSPQEVINWLKSEGFFIISVKEVSSKNITSPLNIFSFLRGKRKRASLKLIDLAFFARNLSTVLSAGVSLLRSLELLASQTESLKLEKVLRNAMEDIKRGFSLSESMNKYPHIFSPLWRGVIEVGEASGNLPLVLERLSDYLEMRLEFERKIKSALVYPIILIIFAIGATLFFMKFFLPRFVFLFKDFNVTLPLPTQILFNFANFLNKYFLEVVIGIILLIIGFIYFQKTSLGKTLLNKIISNLPILGSLVFLSSLERFSSIMYILLESGVPIIYALEVAGKSIGNIAMEKELSYVKEEIKRGKPLSVELGKREIFPPLIIEMTKIGEEVGNMPDMLKRISSHYQRELTTKVAQLVSAFEPFLIVLMGILIGGVVISLFLPIFKISTMGGM